MSTLESLQAMLLGVVEAQFANGIEQVDTKEMGKVIDMVKDLTEAMYYTCKMEKCNKDDDSDASVAGSTSNTII